MVNYREISRKYTLFITASFFPISFLFDVFGFLN